MSDRSERSESERSNRGLAGRVVDAVLTPFVQPVVDAVDVQDVVERIDLDDLIDRVDLDALMDRVDPNRLLDRVDPERLLDRIDPNALLDRIDPNALLDRIDPNALLDRVDPNRLLDRVDPERLLDRIDPNALLARVDVDALMGRVDLDTALGRIDLDAVLDRVDVNAVVDRIDVNAVVARTELGEVIARSTTGVFGQLLDTGRVAVMSLDLALHGLAARLLRRPDPAAQRGPASGEPIDVRLLRPTDRAVALQGRYAGAVSRFFAFLLDTTLTSTLFGLLTALFAAALQIVANISWSADDHRLLVAVLYLVWLFAYFAGLTAVTGRTIGKAVLGLFVVRSDGSAVSMRAAAVRALVFPVSFVLFGAGFAVGVVRRDRCNLHDLIAGTAVVYDWDAELARLRSGSTPFHIGHEQPAEVRGGSHDRDAIASAARRSA